MEKAQVAVGDTVIVQSGGGRHTRTERYVVATIARVWVTLLPQGETRPIFGRRFRLDDQTDGNNVGYVDHFYTLDQWAAHQREEEAETFLREQGIDVTYRSPWWNRKAKLADLIRATDQQTEGTE